MWLLSAESKLRAGSKDNIATDTAGLPETTVDSLRRSAAPATCVAPRAVAETAIKRKSTDFVCEADVADAPIVGEVDGAGGGQRAMMSCDSLLVLRVGTITGSSFGSSP
jgi:hypothetical protein